MSEALIVVLRYILAALFAKLATRGWIKTDDIATLLGPSVTIVVGVAGWLGAVSWALYRSRAAAKIGDVAKMPGITSIHAEPSIANAQPSDKVVATPPAQP